MGFLFSCACAMADDDSGIRFIDEGWGNEKPTREYFARTPYVLSWIAEKNTKRSWKEDPLQKNPEGDVMIQVFDLDSQKYVFSTGWHPLVGKFQVPMAGRHRLLVHTLGSWSVSFTEDQAALKLAAARGELKDGKTLEESKIGSQRGRLDLLAAAKSNSLRRLETFRPKIGEEIYGLCKQDLEKAAQLATSKEDFITRYAAFSMITQAKLGEVKSPPKAAPSKAVSERSTWNGNGLPQGMTRRPAPAKKAAPQP
jgi:hypothetical protein